MLEDDRVLKVMAAIALATSGDTAAANQLADEVARRYPSNTLTQNYGLPTIRALNALAQGRAADAIELLKPALALEQAVGDFTYMQPTYVRGLAYLQLGKGPEAAGEFRRMIEHRGLIGNFVTGALAHLQLGRAEEMSGNRAAARTQYQDFFALWKDADPDLPILKQAKAEYAKIQ